MHSVRAYKMIFAVLERRLIQLLIKWSQFFINNICCFNNHFTNNNLVIILLFVILILVTMAAELLRYWVFKIDVTARSGLSMSTILPNLVTMSQTAAELLRFSVFSKWRQVAILDFVLAPKWRHATLRTVRTYPQTKFGKYISKSGWDMAIFLFQDGGQPPSWFLT